MKTKALLLSAALCAATPAMAVTDIAGVSVPDSISMQGSEMALNGAGIRSKFFMDLYVGSLFTPKAMTEGKAVIASNEPVAIRLNITSDMITSEKMAEAVYDGFKLAMDGDITSIKSSVDTFITAFSEPIAEGDQFTFLSVPNQGVTAFKNGKQLSMTEGEEFRRAVLAIWLGDSPTDEDLKEEMLNQS